jgi:DNA-binding NtrC family response regulator
MKRILIVDDEPNVRLIYRVTLETEGYAVEESGTAEEALQKMRRSPADLAILDLRMPGADGLTLLAEMRQAQILTPAIIITAFSDVPNAVKAMKLGAIDFLQKPLRPEELRSVVREVLERHSDSFEVIEIDNFASHIRLAKKLTNLRRFSEAHKHVARALELETRSAEAFNLAGVLVEVTGDFDRARRYYGQAIRINKSFEPAQQNMRRIFEVLNFGSSDEPINLGKTS